MCECYDRQGCTFSPHSRGGVLDLGPPARSGLFSLHARGWSRLVLTGRRGVRILPAHVGGPGWELTAINVGLFSPAHVGVVRSARRGDWPGVVFPHTRGVVRCTCRRSGCRRRSPHTPEWSIGDRRAQPRRACSPPHARASRTCRPFGSGLLFSPRTRGWSRGCAGQRVRPCVLSPPGTRTRRVVRAGSAPRHASSCRPRTAEVAWFRQRPLHPGARASLAHGGGPELWTELPDCVGFSPHTRG